ncbi:unnamed protein product [Cylicocyclus nassatus]|uniref:Uncharacterized protein n=1 Tax=Cylicocyclus nassatus TaxID=53992 RepID=A0AA36H9X3_CYLNA|nr:unnamed protein product [Cylicocyclus nassatus]
MLLKFEKQLHSFVFRTELEIDRFIEFLEQEDDARESWRRLLYQAAANPDIYPSRDMVDFAVRETPSAADTAAKFLQCEVAEKREDGEQSISALTRHVPFL